MRERIVALMRRKGWTAVQLAVYSGVSISRVYGILNGSDARISTLARLARALGVSLAELLDDRENPIDHQGMTTASHVATSVES